MQPSRWIGLLFRGALPACAVLAAGGLPAQSSPYSGLWVGAATLNAVNEVAVPLDENNVPVAPDPRVPTPTFDHASLRLLLHVNGAGQVFLLKDVAVLNRALVDGQENANLGTASQGDVALVTDPRLYAEFPPQPALRIAAAAFDFGDARASEALDVLAAQAARDATTFVMQPALQLETQAQRVQARNDALAALTPALAETAARADVAAAFEQFLTEFNTAVLEAIAADPAGPEVTDFTGRAQTLRDRSFYQDTRALEMVAAVVAAVEAARGAGPFELAAVELAARNTASSFADVENLYQRFIAGGIFADMLSAAAEAAPAAAKAPGATTNGVVTALRALPAAAEAIAEALRIKVQRYDDRRGEQAIDTVLTAIAAAALDNAALPEAGLRLICAEAGRAALAQRVARYPLPAAAPTLDYNAFVQAPAFDAAVAPAASAAVGAAIDKRAGDPLYTEASVYGAALVAATEALRTPYGEAARARRTDLPLAGIFAAGSGDTRLVRDLAQPGDLGAAGVEGRIVLPASHPTNPFRHRRHPDHTTGFKIERVVRFDFDGVAGDAIEAAGYGVDRIAGTYREEIFGLHKPLGPDPVGAPIGLKTEGRFELRRISTIDTLNAR